MVAESDNEETEWGKHEGLGHCKRCGQIHKIFPDDYHKQHCQTRDNDCGRLVYHRLHNLYFQKPFLWTKTHFQNQERILGQNLAV